MNFSVRLLFFTLLVFGCNSQVAAQKEVGDYLKVYPKEAYLEDLEEFATTLVKTHPQPYAFISQKEFSKVNENTTLGEFIWMCSEIIASIGCGHTSLNFFNQEYHILPDALRFPMDVRNIENRFYVTNPLINADRIEAGQELFAINGIAMSTIKEGIYKHIASDGYSLGVKKKFLNVEFNSYIPYYFGFPKTYEIIVKNKQQPIALMPIKKYNWNPKNGYKNPCKEGLCYEVLEHKSTALLTIRSFAFYGEKYPIFKKFVDDSFRDIASKGIKNLIIDVRGNGGGPSGATAYLMRYFANKPFIYFSKETRYGNELKQEIKPHDNAFKGKTFVLVDNGGFSATGLFLSLVKEHKFATLIGEENGSTYTCNDNSVPFKLANTDISYKVARSTFTTTAKSFPNNIGILPDHNITQNIQDFLNHRDTVLNYTLQLINTH